MATIKIVCPKCEWEPKPTDLWQCSCRHSWHTFDTCGRCPECGKQWNDTQCHGPWNGGCARWSPHVDWYKGLDELMRRELERALRQEPVPVLVPSVPTVA